MPDLRDFPLNLPWEGPPLPKVLFRRSIPPGMTRIGKPIKIHEVPEPEKIPITKPVPYEERPKPLSTPEPEVISV